MEEVMSVAHKLCLAEPVAVAAGDQGRSCNGNPTLCALPNSAAIQTSSTSISSFGAIINYDAVNILVSWDTCTEIFVMNVISISYDRKIFSSK